MGEEEGGSEVVCGFREGETVETMDSDPRMMAEEMEKGDEVGEVLSCVIIVYPLPLKYTPVEEFSHPSTSTPKKSSSRKPAVRRSSKRPRASL